MTTAVYFDLDGTLLEYTRPFGDLLAQAMPGDAPDGMVELYSERVLAGIEQVTERPYERAFEAVCAEYDVEADPATLAADYVDVEATATRIAPAVRQLVTAVADRHPTGILTNGDGRMQRRKLAEHGLDEVVETAVISNEVGARKPDPEIFAEAKRRLPADTHVYVGDTFAEDIAPAREAGFETVYVGEEPNPETAVATDGTEALAAVLLPLLDTTL